MEVDSPAASLLSVPDANAEQAHPDGVVRAVASHDVSDRFILRKRTFTQQYSHVYFQRLSSMRQATEEAARSQWPAVPIIENLLHLPSVTECTIIGCIYKEMKLKPSILEEYAEERSMPKLQTVSKYVDSSDSAVLEDMTGRVTLAGNIDIGMIHTGSVLAIRGRATADGSFEVTDVCSPVMPLQNPVSVQEDKYVVLLSGLNVGNASPSAMVAMQMMIDSITGFLGDVEEQIRQAQIVHTIVAGNLICSKEKRRTERQAAATTVSYSARNRVADSVASIREADAALRDLAEYMPVSVMAGANDPSNHLMPQQPLARCMFPLASTMSTFSTVTNPLDADVDGVSFLGTSGQSIDDAFKFSTTTDRLDLLESILRTRHVAPTAPDTLGCYPFVDTDPFIIEDGRCPHVFFCGNQEKYAHRHIEGSKGQRVLLLTIPTFHESHEIVLVNLRTLEPTLMTFQTPQ